MVMVRSRINKNVGIVLVFLILIYFVVAAYKQSHKNGEALSQASRDRSQLTDSLDRVTRTLDAQTDLILRLQKAIKDQNNALRAAGIKTVVVPTSSSIPSAARNTAQPTVAPAPGVHPSPVPRPTHKPKPTKSPSPTSSPTPDPPQQVVCELLGVLCQRHYIDHAERIVIW